MQDRTTDRFDVVVGVGVAVAFGVLGFFLVGMEVLAYSLWLVPVLGPLSLGVGAIGGVWLIARGGPSKKGFGVGMLVGWVLLAVWSGGLSVGYFG